MIAVDADTVTRMYCRRRAADENGAWHELLQMALGCQQPFPIRKPRLSRFHDDIVARRVMIAQPIGTWRI